MWLIWLLRILWYLLHLEWLERDPQQLPSDVQPFKPFRYHSSLQRLRAAVSFFKSALRLPKTADILSLLWKPRLEIAIANNYSQLPHSHCSFSAGDLLSPSREIGRVFGKHSWSLLYLRASGDNAFESLAY